MKLVGTSSILLVAGIPFSTMATSSVWKEGERKSFRPFRVSFEDLMDDESFARIRQDFLTTLRDVGMITVSEIPEFNKENVFELFHPCLSESSLTQEHVLADGTRRRTLATRTLPASEGMKSFPLSPSEGIDCQDFFKESDGFRSAVATVTELFAKRLSSLFASPDASQPDEKPLLTTRDGSTFQTMADVVNNGLHLEHFHAYQGQTQSSPAYSRKSSDETIEWHTDQGLFIVFAPGVWVRQDSKSKSTIRGLSGGFYVLLQDGSRAVVEVDKSDDLVIMLGDGFNQYINPANHPSKVLRAVPHALNMPPHGPEESRVWYGRMVLPPSDAIHPQHQETFGRLRDILVDELTSPSTAASIGCSDFVSARDLQTTACEEGTLYCWHRCMSAEEHAVSDEICAEQGLDLWCINPRGQLWDDSHGDFFPGCVNASSAEIATPFPVLPSYPREEDECTVAEFDAFRRSGEAYEHEVTIDDVAYLQWSVKDDGLVSGKLSYNGLFGFLALGFPLEGGAKNGMHGAEIIMAVPGGDYSPITGFDLSIDGSVDEYVIDHDGAKSSFRFWSTPLMGTDIVASRAAGSEKVYDVESSDCFTAITFHSKGFHNRAFNVSGIDHLIWAANGVDYFAGYHTHRGHIYVNWANGELATEEPSEHDDGPSDETGAVEASTETDGSTAVARTTISALTVSLTALSFWWLTVN